jgi:hypothetical protein
MSKPSSEQRMRDRAIWFVRLATFGGAAGALGMSWLFANLAAVYFSGKPVAAVASPPPPAVAVEPLPVQKAPPVIVKVVHVPYSGSMPTSGGSAPRPPAQGPGAPPPPPPPPPACHSTPSKPC